MKRTLPMVLICTSLVSCADRKSTTGPRPPSSNENEHAHSDEPKHPSLTKKFRLSREVIASAQIRTEAVVRGTLSETLSLPGEIAADPDRSARVASPAAGRIVRVMFHEGSRVKKNEPLLVVRVPTIGEIQAAHVSAAAKASAARNNAARLEALAQKGLAASQEVLSAKAESVSLEAEARAMQARLSTLGAASAGGGSGSEIVIRAPINGTIVSRNAVIGQPVTADETLATLTDLSEVWFLGRVFEKDLSDLHVGTLADVQLNAFPRDHFHGTVTYIGKQIDPIARTITARIPLANAEEKIRVGLFGMAHVSTGEERTKAPMLIVLRDAVTEIGGKPVVFVQHPDGDFELHELVLGESALGRVEVISGLREGEQVVVDGVFTLQGIALKSTFAEGE